jgi:hypothetical protein
VRFCGCASTARHGQAGSMAPDCLPGSTSSCNVALFSIQCFTCSHLMNSTSRVRLFPRHFFAVPARTACTTPLRKRSLKTRTDDQHSLYINVKVDCVVFVRFCGCASPPRHWRAVWATSDSKMDGRHGGTVQQLSHMNASCLSHTAVSFCGRFQFLHTGSAKPNIQLMHVYVMQQPHKETRARRARGSL